MAVFLPLKQEEHFIPPKEQVLFPHNSFTPDLFNWCIVEAHNQSASSRKHFVPDLLSCCLIPVKSQNPRKASHPRSAQMPPRPNQSSKSSSRSSTSSASPSHKRVPSSEFPPHLHKQYRSPPFLAPISSSSSIFKKQEVLCKM